MACYFSPVYIALFACLFMKQPLFLCYKYLFYSFWIYSRVPRKVNAKTLYNLQEYEFSKGVNIRAEENGIRNEWKDIVKDAKVTEKIINI